MRERERERETERQTDREREREREDRTDICDLVWLVCVCAVDLVDVPIFASIASILKSLNACDTKPALEWCHKNRSKLKKISSPLEFELRRQDLIELCRSGHQEIEEHGGEKTSQNAAPGLLTLSAKPEILANAVAYAKKHLSKFAKADAHDEAFKGLQEVMALVIFGPKTTIAKYKYVQASSKSTLISFTREIIRFPFPSLSFSLWRHTLRHDVVVRCLATRDRRVATDDCPL